MSGGRETSKWKLKVRQNQHSKKHLENQEKAKALKDLKIIVRLLKSRKHGIGSPRKRLIIIISILLQPSVILVSTYYPGATCLKKRQICKRGDKRLTQISRDNVHVLTWRILIQCLLDSMFPESRFREARSRPSVLSRLDYSINLCACLGKRKGHLLIPS